MIYAQVRNSRVRFVVEAESVPVGVDWYDVTAYDPQPQQGWLYDPSGDKFYPQPVRLSLVLTGSKGWIEADGVDAVDITATLFDGDGKIVPANQTAKVVVRDDAGNIRELWRIGLVAGIKTFPYSSTLPGRINTDPRDNYSVEIGGARYEVSISVAGANGLEIGRTF